MSANTTVAPSSDAQLAVATNVIGVVTTSSPLPTPNAAYAVCSAAVPEVTDTAPGVPDSAASSPSNAVTQGPVVSQSLVRTLATAATSSALIDWRPYGSTLRRPSRAAPGSPRA